MDEAKADPRYAEIFETPQVPENAVTKELSTPEDMKGLPANKPEAGEIVPFVAYSKLLIASGRVSTDALPQGFVDAFNTLSQSQIDGQSISDILNDRASLSTRSRHALKALTKVPIGQFLRIIRLTKQLIAQSA